MLKAPPDNLFVKILAGELPSHCVYENDNTYAFLDIFPQSPGHTLVIPRNFSPNVLEADEADIRHCMATVRKLMPAVKQASGAKGITVLTNTGREAGQMIEYLHFHILPRSPQDRISLSQAGKQADNADLAEMAGKIRICLSDQV